MPILVYHYQFKPKNSSVRDNLLFCSHLTSSKDSSILTNENIERPINLRSSHLMCSVKIGVLKTCSNFFVGVSFCNKFVDL